MPQAGLGSPVISIRNGTLIPYAALIVVLLALGFYAILVVGPAQRALAQDQLARTIAEETRAVCERFGMRDGTSQFLDCAQALATIRQKQVDRDHAAEQGL